jgi:hypothetical protein
MAFNRGEVTALRVDGIEAVEVVDGSGCLPDGHDDEALGAQPGVRGVQWDREADGQVWTLDEVGASDVDGHGLLVGHPNCRRALIEAA